MKTPPQDLILPFWEKFAFGKLEKYFPHIGILALDILLDRK